MAAEIWNSSRTQTQVPDDAQTGEWRHDVVNGCYVFSTGVELFPRAACKGKHVRVPSQQSPEHRERRQNPIRVSCRPRAGGDARRTRVGRSPKAGKGKARGARGGGRRQVPAATSGCRGVSSTEGPLSDHTQRGSRRRSPAPAAPAARSRAGGRQGGARPHTPPPWHSP